MPAINGKVSRLLNIAAPIFAFAVIVQGNTRGIAEVGKDRGMESHRYDHRQLADFPNSLIGVWVVGNNLAGRLAKARA